MSISTCGRAESDVNDLIDGLVADFKARGVAEESEGAWVVRVARDGDKKELAPLILVTSEGSSLYGTTDLATILDRKQSVGPDLTLYVVDLAQSDHFEQVFRAADKAGLAPEGSLEHVKFGTVNGTDGKRLRTRDGGTFRLADLIASAIERADQRLKEAGLAADVGAEEHDRVARMVGLAAIKFADLQNYRTTNYVFDLDRFTSFEGKTGPYLLYAAVRVKSFDAPGCRGGGRAGADFGRGGRGARSRSGAGRLRCGAGASVREPGAQRDLRPRLHAGPGLLEILLGLPDPVG